MNEKYWIILADAQLGAIHWQHSQREEDYYEAFQTQCLKASMDKNCLGILGLGDLRERASIQAKNLGGLNRGLKILSDSNKPLLALMGNHDKTAPNWINEMCYPSLKDLTDSRVQEKFGFDPKTTLASHFLPKSEIKELIKNHGKDKKTFFLHQSLKELTTHLLQSYDLCLEDFTNLGLGKETKCEVFVGDLHNYGDISANFLTIAYPGSLEMTDINEGVNGLKSERLKSHPHDYRKFVIHYFPNRKDNNWVPVEIKPRPWFRGKAKNERETGKILEILKSIAGDWHAPACALITLPKEEITEFRLNLQGIKFLELRLEEYDPYIDQEEENLEAQQYEHCLSWQENKKRLQEMASSALDTDSSDLLAEICSTDGSNHSTKVDVSQAWNKWRENKGSNKPLQQT